MIRTEDIKTLRAETGASISDVKAALEEAGGDVIRAAQILERAMGERGGKKNSRETHAGVVDCYVHTDKKMGVMLELLCETDFVARTDEFRALAHDIALHIAAMNPLYLDPKDAPSEVVDAERRLVVEDAVGLAKPREVIDQIVAGKLAKHFEESSLLTQPYVKNQDKTVGEVLVEAAGKFGENIRVGRFIRFSL